MKVEKTISFRVQNGAKPKTYKTPVWREVEAENAECPNCHISMTVVVSKSAIYAHCTRCQRYYVGE